MCGWLRPDRIQLVSPIPSIGSRRILPELCLICKTADGAKLRIANGEPGKGLAGDQDGRGAFESEAPLTLQERGPGALTSLIEL